LKQNISDGNAPQAFLAYINGNHEYVLFDPYGNDANELSIARREGLVELEETGGASFTKTSTILVKTIRCPVYMDTLCLLENSSVD
jgi:hypothetical protein